MTWISWNKIWNLESGELKGRGWASRWQVCWILKSFGLYIKFNLNLKPKFSLGFPWFKTKNPKNFFLCLVLESKKKRKEKHILKALRKEKKNSNIYIYILIFYFFLYFFFPFTFSLVFFFSFPPNFPKIVKEEKEKFHALWSYKHH